MLIIFLYNLYCNNKIRIIKSNNYIFIISIKIRSYAFHFGIYYIKPYFWVLILCSSLENKKIKGLSIFMHLLQLIILLPKIFFLIFYSELLFFISKLWYLHLFYCFNTFFYKFIILYLLQVGAFFALDSNNFKMHGHLPL